MAILKSDSKNKDFKLIGANVPPHMHQYLSLYCLAKGTTKSKLFKVLLEEWMTKQRTTETDDALITQLVSRIEDQWDTQKMNHTAITFDKFKGVVKKEMEDRGLKRAYIELVLSKAKP